MPDSEKGKKDSQQADESGGGATAVAKPKKAKKTAPKQKPPQMLPPWKVLLHNDDKNEMGYVILTVMELTTLNEQDAKLRTLEAHETGVALLLTTHKERAELYVEHCEVRV